MSECTELRERRQLVRDQVFLSGPEHFDMAYWFGYRAVGSLTEDFTSAELNTSVTIDINACGTVGCLAGHAALALFGAEGTQRKGVTTDAIAELLEIDSNVFLLCWYHVRLSDGRSLGNVHHAYSVAFDLHPLDIGTGVPADWHAILDYLDDLIKTSECPEDLDAA